VIAAAGIHHTFAELRYLLAPLFAPTEASQVFALLPSAMQASAWEALELETTAPTETFMLRRAA
jgi:hypothetical protein